MNAKIQRTRLSPEARRAQLITCAMGAFAEHGVARATHSHVAERAGVSIPTVYAYFRTRDDLVAAVLEAVEAYILRVVSAALGAPDTVSAALTLSAVNFANCALTDPDIIKVWLDWSTGVRADIWPRYLDMLNVLHGITEDLLRGGQARGELSQSVDVRAAARLYIGGGHTVALMQYSGSSPAELTTLIDHLVRSIIGIGEAGRARK
jgi:TetR/AcrR family hemagglutinin/protease transcriptional regulator